MLDELILDLKVDRKLRSAINKTALNLLIKIIYQIIIRYHYNGL